MMNKAILIGHLGRDPELRYTSGGQPVVNFTMATNENWRDGDGERQTRTEWHRIVVWGKTAEFASQYLSKGRLVYVEGRIETTEWEGRDGEKKRTTQVVARILQALDGRRNEDAPSQSQEQRGRPGKPPLEDDDICF